MSQGSSVSTVTVTRDGSLEESRPTRPLIQPIGQAIRGSAADLSLMVWKLRSGAAVRTRTSS